MTRDSRRKVMKKGFVISNQQRSQVDFLMNTEYILRLVSHCMKYCDSQSPFFNVHTEGKQQREADVQAALALQQHNLPDAT